MNKIVVLGGGESGVGAAILAKKEGFDVFLSDKGQIGENYIALLESWNINYEQGKHSEEKILKANEIIKSPGIPNNIPLLQTAKYMDIPIISEIEFASRYDRAKKICITGSNGKTTTSSLIYHLLKEAGLNVGLAGNIGNSYAYQVATQSYDYYVLEISSFQLDNCYDFRPDIAIITNITADHLDRYDYNIDNYVKAKFRITRNLRKEDCFIFDLDDQITINHLSQIVLKAKMLAFTQDKSKNIEEGAYIDNDKIVIKYNNDSCEVFIKELALGGKHNIYNSMASAIAAKVAGIDNETIRKALSSFQAIEHRLEPVLTKNGVLYINDSKATNLDSAWYALDCQSRPIVWIVGGKDKGNDYSCLKNIVKEKVKAIVCLGLDNSKIHRAFEEIVGKDNIVDSQSAHDAVQKASSYAKEGDVVLLSPCCASFDLFNNYEDRGCQFKDAVKNL